MTEKVKTPFWFWLLALFGVLWYGMGVAGISYQLTLEPEALEEFGKTNPSVLLHTPMWYVVAFAISVFGGLTACISLLLKRAMARSLFIIALISVLVQMTYTIFIDGNLGVYGPGGLIMPVMITALAIFYVWFSGYAIKKHWIV